MTTPEADLERLKKLNALHQALASVELTSHSLQTFLHLALDTAAQLTGATYGALAIFNETGEQLTEFLTTGLDEATRKKIGAMPTGRGLLGVMTKETGVLRLKDLSRHKQSVGFPPHHPSMSSFLGCSVQAHGKLFGRFYLTNKRGADEFTDLDAEVLSLLTAQVGTVVESKSLLDQLQRSEARYRQILESTAEGIYGLDLDGNCTFVNKAGADMLGYRPEELTGRRMHGLIHHTRPNGSPYPEEDCPTERSRRQGRPSYLIEDSYWRKDGASFPVQLSCAPILSDGALRGAVVTFLNITERKRAEVSLKLFRSLLDQANDAIEIIDPATARFIDCNEKACADLGYTREEFLSLSVPDIDPLVTLPVFMQYMAQFREAPEGGAVTLESVHRRKDGSTFPIEVNCRLVRLDREYVLAIVRDITERKRAETTLQESEERYRVLVEGSPTGIFINVDDRFAYANKAFCHLVGASSPDRLLGTPVFDRIDPAFHETVRQRIRRVGEGITAPLLSLRYLRLDGSPVYVETIATAMTMQGRSATHVMINDITERKRAEEALAESQRIYSTLLSNLPGMVYRCLHDQDYTVTFANEGTQKLTGYPASGFISKRINFGQLIHPDDQTSVWDAVSAAVEARRPFQLTYRIRTAEGEEKWVWENGCGVYAPAGELQFLEGFITDITDRKRAEEALRGIIEGTVSTTGHDFFRSLTSSLAKSLHLRHAFIGELMEGRSERIRTLAVWTKDRFIDNFEYDLAGTPCENVVGKRFCYHDKDVQNKFPRDPMLLELGVISYCAVPLFAPSGEPTGILAILHDDGLPSVALIQDLLTVFSARAATELERKRAEKTLQMAHARLQLMSRRLRQVQEEEQKRIARELHDELGQQLTMLRFGLVKLAQASPVPLPEQVHALTQTVDRLIESVRRIATSVRPAILDDLGLNAALEWLISDFKTRSGLPCDATLAPIPESLDELRSLTLYRILQEALTNVARHAQATHVTINLQKTVKEFILEVHDNGRGMTQAQQTNTSSIGLFGMQERALLVGGVLTIESLPNEGTTVTARIPLA